jgi:hypothetical protein
MCFGEWRQGGREKHTERVGMKNHERYGQRGLVVSVVGVLKNLGPAVRGAGQARQGV